MTLRRAVVTGLGVIAPNGFGTEAFWAATTDGRSGIGRLTAFDPAEYTCRIAGEVDDYRPDEHFDHKQLKHIDRFAQLGVVASRMAVADSGLDPTAEDPHRLGCLLGSGLGGVLFHEEQMIVNCDAGPRRQNPYAVPRIAPNAVSAHIAIEHDLKGPNLVISTACASGNHAIGEALRKVQHGEADVVFTGGVEAPLTRTTFGAYCALRVMSTRNNEPERASRPFDKDRDGFVMSEGAAVLILEELEHALRRGARVYAELAGYGLTSGAYHMVMPDPSGDDAAAAMRAALADAQASPRQVDYINAHGTSTQANDLAETRAIRTVFGEHTSTVPVSSTKSMTGHTIGAAGAIEAAVCCLALDRQVLPPTINYETPDPECDLDCVPNMARPATVALALSNSFGFGSVNACVAFRRYAREGKDA
ncbi:MAG: beta-ketoacyl-ACP synthase II [Armatimonadetes bacterium]|nr:beta-ketoacyl-ACP synthase II [Armatimonadota bacterium]